jgi:integrase
MPNNPMDMVFHSQHEREHGTALSKDEEKLLLSSMKGTPQELMFAIGLYTGMRPNEYETARIEGNFIVAINSKRKNGKVEYKKIPVTPMLQPYLTGVDEIKFSSLRVLRDRFNKLFPQRRLYDLRTTFYTRCTECGVAAAARDEYVGHSLGALGNAYTDLSDEFLFNEGQKFRY